MDKKRIYEFSLKLKQYFLVYSTTEIANMINTADLSNEELDFLFMCLNSDGYDVKTDSFILCHSDNSAFLALVNKVQDKVKDKK